MRFRSHQCWFPKDVEFPNEYEDASACSERHGRAVVADGVSSAIFSRTWARMLSRSALESLPDFAHEESIWEWLSPLQQAWRQGINFHALPWHQKPKATSLGAQATLLMVQVEPIDAGQVDAGQVDAGQVDAGQVDAGQAEPQQYRLRASGIGDCVLFLIRDGQKTLSFPLTDSAAFAEPPHILSSIAKGVTYSDKFRYLDDRCCVGDLLVVCSDAIGLWAMQEYESGREVDWMRYWGNEEAWQADIQTLRSRPSGDDGNRMRVDDCTLLLLQIVAEDVIEGEPNSQPDKSDEPFTLFGKESTTADASGATTADAGGLPEQASGDQHLPIDTPSEAGATSNDSLGDDGLSEAAGDARNATCSPPTMPVTESSAGSTQSEASSSNDLAKEPSKAPNDAHSSRSLFGYVDAVVARWRGRDG